MMATILLTVLNVAKKKKKRKIFVSFRFYEMSVADMELIGGNMLKNQRQKNGLLRQEDLDKSFWLNQHVRTAYRPPNLPTTAYIKRLIIVCFSFFLFVFIVLKNY